MRARPVAAALLLSACAAGTRLGSDPDDYAAYRRTRTAPTLEDRLSASWSYLTTRPEGAFREEVRAWFIAAEATYREDTRGNLPRLRRYLETLPEAPHSEDVESEVAALERSRERARWRSAQLGDHADRIERDLAAAEEGRRTLLRTVSRFASHLAGIRTWGERTSELDHRLLFDWRIDPPAARCAGRRCTKSLLLDYAIPEEGAPSPRQAVLDVVIQLDEAGGVASATLVGPDLWSRVGEAAELLPVLPADGQARAEAIAKAIFVVEAAVEPALPSAECVRDAVSPIVLARECRGVRFEMIAATSLEEEDRIVASSAPTPPGPGLSD